MSRPPPPSLDDEPGERQLHEAVMGYLAEHPQAMDTLEGIAQWWITRRQVRVDVERLSRVLQRLTDSGILEEVGSGKDRRYRLKKPGRAS